MRAPNLLPAAQPHIRQKFTTDKAKERIDDCDGVILVHHEYIVDIQVCIGLAKGAALEEGLRLRASGLR